MWAGAVDAEVDAAECCDRRCPSLGRVIDRPARGVWWVRSLWEWDWLVLGVLESRFKDSMARGHVLFFVFGFVHSFLSTG